MLARFYGRFRYITQGLQLFPGVMEMDREMLKVLSGEENIGMDIEETVAAGDPRCRITYSTR